jgi:hypothetical protein
MIKHTGIDRVPLYTGIESSPQPSSLPSVTDRNDLISQQHLGDVVKKVFEQFGFNSEILNQGANISGSSAPREVTFSLGTAEVTCHAFGSSSPETSGYLIQLRYPPNGNRVHEYYFDNNFQPIFQRSMTVNGSYRIGSNNRGIVSLDNSFQGLGVEDMITALRDTLEN